MIDCQCVLQRAVPSIRFPAQTSDAITIEDGESEHAGRGASSHARHGAPPLSSTQPPPRTLAIPTPPSTALAPAPFSRPPASPLPPRVWRRQRHSRASHCAHTHVASSLAPPPAPAYPAPAPSPSPTRDPHAASATPPRAPSRRQRGSALPSASGSHRLGRRPYSASARTPSLGSLPPRGAAVRVRGTEPRSASRRRTYPFQSTIGHLYGFAVPAASGDGDECSPAFRPHGTNARRFPHALCDSPSTGASNSMLLRHQPLHSYQYCVCPPPTCSHLLSHLFCSLFCVNFSRSSPPQWIALFLVCGRLLL